MKKSKCLDLTSVEKKETKTLEPRPRPYKVVDQIRDGYSMRMKPISEAYLQDLAIKLVTDARKDPDILSFESFFDRYDLNWTSFDSWCKKYPFMAEGREKARLAFASRIENGLLKGKEGIKEKGARDILPAYSRTWKEREDTVAALNKKEESKTSFTVHLGDLPSSDMVPYAITRKIEE